MTQVQINQVQGSYSMIAGTPDEVAALFYHRLFTLAPDLRPMFKAGLSEQGRKLMQALGLAVSNLRTPEKVVPALEELGRRHRGYGVLDAHYDTVGSALLWTLREGLGRDFTPDLEEAWGKAYALVADVMKAG